MLRQIFGPRRNLNTGEYEQRNNNDVVICMLEDSHIIAMMKSKRIDVAGRV